MPINSKLERRETRREVGGGLTFGGPLISLTSHSLIHLYKIISEVCNFGVNKIINKIIILIMIR